MMAIRLLKLINVLLISRVAYSDFRDSYIYRGNGEGGVNPKTWDDARAFCINDMNGMELASVTNDVERDVITKII
jgi:hypothetical protein